MNGAASSPPVKRRKMVEDVENGEAEEAGEREGVRGEARKEKEAEQLNGAELVSEKGQEKSKEKDEETLSGEQDGGKGKLSGEQKKKEAVSSGKEEEEVEGMEEGEADLDTPVRGGATEGATTPSSEKKNKPIHPFFSETLPVFSLLIFCDLFSSFSYSKESKK